MSKPKHVTEGFRWCEHCRRPHHLADRICVTTRKEIDGGIHRGPSTPSESPMVGVVLDRKYRILRTIGSGGMGMVFEAENLTLHKMVAIKVVGARPSPSAFARLLREAKLVAAVQHPNICDLYDIGQLPTGGPYLVLERLFGETLAASTRFSRKPALRPVVDVFVQILSGLQAAHAAQIVHRDLKPQNIFLVDRSGLSPFVKILDFGFAHDMSANSEESITRPGRASGTLQYMSPEQVRGERVEQQSDIFAVGVMLYETLTGKHPFSAASSHLDLLKKIVEGEARPLRQRRPDLPVEIELIVSRAMSKDPARRPSSANELQASLLSAVVGGGGTLLPLDDEEPPSQTGPLWLPPSSSRSG